MTSDNPFTGVQVLSVSRGSNGYSTYISFPVREMSWSEIEGSPDLANLRLGQEIHDGTRLTHRAWQPVTNLVGFEKTNLWIIDRSSQKKSLTAVWDDKLHRYKPLAKDTKPYELPTLQEVPLTDRLQGLVSAIEAALPNILALTNKISTVLDNSAALTSNLNNVAESARPAASNLAVITAQLREPKGSLGEWLIPTNLNAQLETTLLNANVTITNADTNLVALAESIGRSLENLANITSNLNVQVQSNSNMLRQISDIVVHSDEFVQGLKRHWLLRSAFKTPSTNAPGSRSAEPLFSPRASGGRQ